MKAQKGENNVEEGIPPDSLDRYQVVSEILSSEQLYVEQLNVVCSVYMKRLENLAESSSPVLSMDIISAIFSNLVVIKELNGNFFQTLNNRISKWNSKSLIGDVFVDFAPFFKMYISYVNNQESANQILNNELKSNSAFSDFCKQREMELVTRGQSLQSFLILPVQRIPRYLLLTKDLLKCTPINHPDFQNISKALNLLSEVAEKINIAIGEYKNRNDMYAIQEKFVDDIILIEPKRKFLLEGTLVKICRAKQRRYVFLLFSDLLIYANKTGNKLKLHRQIKIDQNFKVENLKDTDKIFNRFTIVTSSKSFEVYAEDYSTKENWLNCLNMAIEKRKKGKNNQTITSFAPVWQPDISSKSCRICLTKFSMFKRRHHCRKCGELVCNECSKGRDIIKGMEENSYVRVCDRCFGKREEKNILQKSKTNTKPELIEEIAKIKTETAKNKNKNEKSPVRCLALYDYIGVNENELSFKKNDLIYLIEQKSNWWTGKLENNIGAFPSNYVKLIDNIEENAKSASSYTVHEPRFKQNRKYEINLAEISKKNLRADSTPKPPKIPHPHSNLPKPNSEAKSKENIRPKDELKKTINGDTEKICLMPGTLIPIQKNIPNNTKTVKNAPFPAGNIKETPLIKGQKIIGRQASIKKNKNQNENYPKKSVIYQNLPKNNENMSNLPKNNENLSNLPKNNENLSNLPKNNENLSNLSKNSQKNKTLHKELKNSQKKLSLQKTNSNSFSFLKTMQKSSSLKSTMTRSNKEDKKCIEPSNVEVEFLARANYLTTAKGELAFKKGDRLGIRLKRKDSAWCFGVNKTTMQIGWVSADYIEGDKSELKKLEFQKLKMLGTCICTGFSPNSFRPSLCKDCFHNVKSHII